MGPGRGHALAVEQAPDDRRGLVEPADTLTGTLAEREAVGAVLTLEPGRAQAEDRASAADVVQRRGELRGDGGRMEGVGADEEPETDMTRPGRPRAKDGPGLEDRLVGLALRRREVVD